MNDVTVTITDVDQPAVVGRSWTTSADGTHRPWRPNKVYVASSWRCALQPAVVTALRCVGIDCYDFRHPAPGNEGFHWSEVMPSYRRVGPGSPEQLADADEYLEALRHPIAEAGFAADFDAMQECDTCVLVLPCGRSAHLELGWFVGQGRRTAILLDGPTVVPELMYKMVDYVAPTLIDLLGWLGVED